MIGDTVKFKNYLDEISTAKIVGIFSDKYEDIKIDDGYFYWSKKTKSYRPIKEKDRDSLYFEVESSRGKTDFVLLEDIVY